MQPSFWRGKRVFVTGHTGFKGTWLTFWLCWLGASITGFALDPVPGSCYNDLDFPGLNDIRGDIRDRDKLCKSFSNAQPEIVIHLASQAFIAESLKDPAATYETNVLGLVNLMDAIRECENIRAALIVTSDKAYYGECSPSGFSEEQTLLGGMEPYSGSKAAQELVVDSYRNAFLKDRGVATARASNVIGGGDPFTDRLIPAMLSVFGQGKAVQIRNPLAVRPWQNVLDCLNGYLTLTQKLYEQGHKFSGVWNFGPTRDGMQTVEWIAKHMAEAWGENAAYEITAPGMAMPEKDNLRLDISKAVRELDWKPQFTLEETLRQVVEFEKDKLAGKTYQSMFEGLVGKV